MVLVRGALGFLFFDVSFTARSSRNFRRGKSVISSTQSKESFDRFSFVYCSIMIFHLISYSFFCAKQSIFTTLTRHLTVLRLFISLLFTLSL